MASFGQGYCILPPDDVALFMQGSGAYSSSYSHWMKWDLPSLVDEGRRLPDTASLFYQVKATAFETDCDFDSCLYTNSDVSWTSSTSLANLKLIFGDDGGLDIHRVTLAQRIGGGGNTILVESSGDMPTANTTFHSFDILNRVKSIYTANALGACQMTARHMIFSVNGSYAGGNDTSVAEKTLVPSVTSFWLQHVTKPGADNLETGWSYTWDGSLDSGYDMVITFGWYPRDQINMGLSGGINIGLR